MSAPPPPEPSPVLGPIEYRFAPEAASIRLARHVLANWLELQPGVASDALDDLLIACSELVTNAINHATGPADSVLLRAEVVGDAVRLQIEDDGRGFVWPVAHVMADVLDDDEHGRGLFIVEELTDRLEVHATAGRTVVTCLKQGVLRQAASVHPDGDGDLSARFRAESHPGDTNRRTDADHH